MDNYYVESKRLLFNLKEKADEFVRGEFSLDEPLRKTEELYDQAFEAAKTSTAGKFSCDSELMQAQSEIVRKRARAYKPDTLVFNTGEFSEKLKKYYLYRKSETGASNNDRNRKLSHQQYSMIWCRLGEESLKKMHFAPTFDFLYGTFCAEPASPVKKKRKRIEKDKLAAVVKPKTVDASEKSEGQDFMVRRAERTFKILQKYIEKSNKRAVCFYEFVIDPQSFTHTIENIFTVTLLLQSGYVCIFPDEQGLPWLRDIDDAERKERKMEPRGRMQSVLSMSVDEWQTIIRKCNFTKALIPQKNKEAQEK